LSLAAYELVQLQAGEARNQLQQRQTFSVRVGAQVRRDVHHRGIGQLTRLVQAIAQREGKTLLVGRLIADRNPRLARNNQRQNAAFAMDALEGSNLLVDPFRLGGGR